MIYIHCSQSNEYNCSEQDTEHDSNEFDRSEIKFVDTLDEEAVARRKEEDKILCQIIKNSEPQYKAIRPTGKKKKKTSS